MEFILVPFPEDGKINILFRKFNILTPRSDQDVNSPYIFNSVKQIANKNEENYQLCDILDTTINSQEYPTKKCMVLVRRIKFQILGVKGLSKRSRIIRLVWSRD